MISLRSCDINRQDHFGETALHVAVLEVYGQPRFTETRVYRDIAENDLIAIPIIQKLLTHKGIDLTIKDDEGETALQAANSQEIKDLLRARDKK